MEEAERCRQVTRGLVADVEPDRLRAVIHDELAERSVLPGVLAMATAEALREGSGAGSGAIPGDRAIAESRSDGGVDAATPEADAAGVQLVYAGLALTRSLIHSDPWAGADGERGPAADRADMAILAADVMVARGFVQLAGSPGCRSAVRTAQAFGRNQTLREEPGADVERLDADLERDVLELAIVAGAGAVGAEPTPELLAHAEAIVEEHGTDLPPVEVGLEGFQAAAPDPSAGEAGSTDRATSATDP